MVQLGSMVGAFGHGCRQLLELSAIQYFVVYEPYLVWRAVCSDTE